METGCDHEGAPLDLDDEDEHARHAEPQQSSLTRRAVYLPVDLNHPYFEGRVRALASALARAQRRAALEVFEKLRVAAEEDLQGLGLDHETRATYGRRALRALTLASVLLDLDDAGWELALEGSELYGLAPQWGAARDPSALVSEKARARRLVAPRRAAQLSSPEVRRFVRTLERSARGPGVSALIADGAALADALSREGSAAVRPYLQLARACDGVDEMTGLRLADCFRYFRYYWSFPYESTPGRRLPLLIRDAGQPRHPVCGLLCLVSPLPQLASRDVSLGWSPAWLEAVIAALDAPAGVEGEPLAAALAAAWGRLEVNLARAPRAPRAPQLAGDLASLLGLPERPRDLRRLLKALRAEDLSQARLHEARVALASALLQVVRAALETLSFEDLGCEARDVFADPQTLNHLEARRATLEGDWRARRHTSVSPERQELVFKSKRARKALMMGEAWWDLQALRGGLAQGEEALSAALRAATSKREEPWGEGGGLTEGRDVRLGLLRALREHKVGMIASRVADVAVCGALEPYRDLLGGKLAAMLALSEDAARHYQSSYEGQVSEIQSRMSGARVIRDARLTALVTTSFYSVGSAQYNRVRVSRGGAARAWERVGMSDGQGTMHLSRRTSELIQRLLAAHARSATHSRFGEGPSERLRKLREGLSLLSLPADALLTHGMSRIVYVARLSDECLPGVSAAPDAAPSAEEVCEEWRQRWLAPRLSDPARLARLRELRPSDLCLGAELEALGDPEPSEEGPLGAEEPERERDDPQLKLL